MSIPAMARAALLMVVVVSGCKDPQHGTRPDTTALRREQEATAQFEDLLRRRLTDPDPVTVQAAILCETRRVLQLVGPARLVPALEAAGERAYQPSDQARLQVVRQLVAHRTYEASDSLCLRLGRAGYLKDTTWIAGAGL